MNSNLTFCLSLHSYLQLLGYQHPHPHLHPPVYADLLGGDAVVHGIALAMGEP